MKKSKVTITKSRGEGCWEPLLITLQQLQQLPMVESITLNSHLSKERTVSG
jgi:hypothetical protein